MSKPVLTVGRQGNSATQVFNQRGTKYGGAAVQGLAGPYFESAMQGEMFHASTVIAGKIALVAAATLAGVFTVYNPASSGVNVELVSFSWGPTSATTVVNTVGLLIQRNLATSGGVPTTVTEGSITRLGISGTSAAKFYSVATLTNAAIPGAVGSAIPIPFYPMIYNGATTDANAGDLTHWFNGKIILEPDSLVSVCTNITTATISTMSMDWAERPV